MGTALLLTSISLANIEMRLIFAKMIWWFDLELMPESKEWPNQQYIYTTCSPTCLSVPRTMTNSCICLQGRKFR